MQKYYTTNEICKTIGRSRNTLLAWRKDTQFPFPEPHIQGGGKGAQDRYLADVVDKWLADGGPNKLSFRTRKPKSQ